MQRGLPLVCYFRLVRCLVLGLGDGIGRREFITLIGGAAAWPISARAQPTTKIPRIGVLSPGGSDKSDASLTTINAFIPVLRELGYTEGQNIMRIGCVDWRLNWLNARLTSLSRLLRRPSAQPSKRPPQSPLSQLLWPIPSRMGLSPVFRGQAEM